MREIEEEKQAEKKAQQKKVRITHGLVITPDKDKDKKEAQLIVNQIDWRKAKKEKIHRIYDEYRKPNFPREIRASKFDESSAIKLPLGNLVW